MYVMHHCISAINNHYHKPQNEVLVAQNDLNVKIFFQLSCEGVCVCVCICVKNTIVTAKKNQAI